MKNGRWKTEDDEEGLSMPGTRLLDPRIMADSPSVRIPYDMIIVL